MKFQSIIIEKKKQDHTKETFKIGNKLIEASLSKKLLGVQLDNKVTLVWMFSGKSVLDKIVSLQKRHFFTFIVAMNHRTIHF